MSDDDKQHTWDWRPRAGTDKPAGPSDTREWALIEKLVLAQTREQRRARRWGILFKSLTFIYLFILLAGAFSARDALPGFSPTPGDHIAVVPVDGAIGNAQGASLERLRGPIRRAFSAEDSTAVVLDIDSPGGSAVQSQQIHQLISDLRSDYPDKPVYAVIGDIAASGGYYIAVAADEIYASPASLVGSIGVISGGFGFNEAMAELGIERRLYTAGENKAFLDSFLPEDPAEVEHWQTVLETVFRQFADTVRAARGDRLSEDANVISGLVWSGEQAQQVGLIDGFDTLYDLAEQLGGAELVVYEPETDPWTRVLRDFGMMVGHGAAQAFGTPGLSYRVNGTP